MRGCGVPPGKTALLFTDQFCSPHEQKHCIVFISCQYGQRVVVHLGEVDVLCSCEVEALLAALVLQQTLCEPICHFHVAAVVFLCVHGGVGQHGCRLLNMSGVQERGITGKLLRLEEEKENTTIG